MNYSLENPEKYNKTERQETILTPDVKVECDDSFCAHIFIYYENSKSISFVVFIFNKRNGGGVDRKRKTEREKWSNVRMREIKKDDACTKHNR